MSFDVLCIHYWMMKQVLMHLAEHALQDNVGANCMSWQELLPCILGITAYLHGILARAYLCPTQTSHCP